MAVVIAASYTFFLHPRFFLLSSLYPFAHLCPQANNEAFQHITVLKHAFNDSMVFIALLLVIASFSPLNSIVRPPVWQKTAPHTAAPETCSNLAT